MRERVVQMLLLGVIVASSCAVVYAIATPHHQQFDLSPDPPVAEHYWWNKFRYGHNVGKNACDPLTGAHAGTIERVYYGDWTTPDGWKREKRWLYTITESKFVETGRTSSGVSLRIAVPPLPPQPAARWSGTAGQCPDGRP